MTASLNFDLESLNYKDQSEVDGLVDLFVYDGSDKIYVGQTHRDCLPAFEKIQQEQGLFEHVDERSIVMRSDLQTFDDRVAALRAVIGEIDQNPTIFGQPTTYSLDDYRPLPCVNDPLLAISRPYCRKGFNVPTDCAYLFLQKSGTKELLFTLRSEKIGADDDTTGADNYAGKFDVVGGAHVFDSENTSNGSVTDVYLASALKRANEKVGLRVEDISEVAYLAWSHLHRPFVIACVD